MNTSDPNNPLPGQDQVSRAYRAAGFKEEPPAALGRTILERAKRHRRRPLVSFMRPLALAATVVLSVSLVLRSGILNENAEVFSDGSPPASPVRTVPAATTVEFDDAASADESATQNSPVPATAIESFDILEAVDSLESIQSIETLIDSESEDATLEAILELAPSTAAPEELEVRGREAQPALRQEAAGEAPRVPAISAEAQPMLEDVTASEQFDCSGVDREQPDDWLACIVSGLEQGMEQEAREELAEFVQAYPEVALPENIDALRVP